MGLGSSGLCIAQGSPRISPGSQQSPGGLSELPASMCREGHLRGPDGLTCPRACSAPSGFKSFSLTSVELQMLTNSCVKLQTVHHIPLTINKEGKAGLLGTGLTC